MACKETASQGGVTQGEINFIYLEYNYTLIFKRVNELFTASFDVTFDGVPDTTETVG